MASNMSNYNSSAARVRPQAGNPYGARPQGARPQAQASRSNGKKPPVQKNKRREKDYFFIMRRGVCFLIMLLAIVWIAVIALNYVAVLPQYTSFLIVPDLTPESERVDVETGDVDEDGNAIVEEYQDKSIYISMLDPVFGVLKKFVGLEMTDSDGNSMSGFYDSFSPALNGTVAGEEEEEEPNEEEPVAEAATVKAAEEEGEEAAGEEGDGEASDEEAEADDSVKFGTVPANTDIDAEAREADTMGSLAAMVFDFAPIVLLVGVVFALIIFILAFLSLFGRRIFKGFGIMSIIMILAGVAMLLAGMAAMGNYMGNPSFDSEGGVVSVLDFGQLTSFALGAFQGPPAEAVEEAVEAAQLTMVAGYGLLIIVIIPIVMLILSIFARKKIPYSIFDK